MLKCHNTTKKTKINIQKIIESNQTTNNNNRSDGKHIKIQGKLKTAILEVM